MAQITNTAVADFSHWPGRRRSRCQCSGGSKVAQGMAGALSARPLSYDNPRALQCFNNKGLSTCLVSMSAGFSAPSTLESLKSPFLMRSCTHRSAVAKCRTFPSPLLRHIPIAAVASVRTDKFRLMPKSLAMVCRPNPWAAPLQIPVSSASAELNATVACVVDQCLMR